MENSHVLFLELLCILQTTQHSFQFIETKKILIATKASIYKLIQNLLYY